jgi:tRNA-dihydrouridine synthase A
MVTAAAVIHGDRDKLLGFDASEHPVALQLGGSEPRSLAEAASIGADRGYDEINLNCGCPSDRVQEGRFGACLMREPHLVADCLAAMQAAVGDSVPVTVKCRIGVDDQDAEEELTRFVATVSAAGCSTIVVHARKAWLKGLSPKENREIPPLDYERVRRLKAAFPHLIIVLNGGIASLDEALTHLEWADGVMLGRAAYQNPALLAQTDRRIFGEDAPDADLFAAYEAMIDYAVRRIAAGEKLSAVTRHMLGLFQNRPGARAYRRHLSELAPRRGAGAQVMRDALAHVARPGEIALQPAA